MNKKYQKGFLLVEMLVVLLLVALVAAYVGTNMVAAMQLKHENYAVGIVRSLAVAEQLYATQQIPAGTYASTAAQIASLSACNTNPTTLNATHICAISPAIMNSGTTGTSNGYTFSITAITTPTTGVLLQAVPNNSASGRKVFCAVVPATQLIAVRFAIGLTAAGTAAICNGSTFSTVEATVGTGPAGATGATGPACLSSDPNCIGPQGPKGDPCLGNGGAGGNGGNNGGSGDSGGSGGGQGGNGYAPTQLPTNGLAGDNPCDGKGGNGGAGGFGGNGGNGGWNGTNGMNATGVATTTVMVATPPGTSIPLWAQCGGNNIVNGYNCNNQNFPLSPVPIFGGTDFVYPTGNNGGTASTHTGPPLIIPPSAGGKYLLTVNINGTEASVGVTCSVSTSPILTGTSGTASGVVAQFPFNLNLTGYYTFDGGTSLNLTCNGAIGATINSASMTAILTQ